IEDALATRINRHGVLRVSSQRHRSQIANREATVERFAELLREALTLDPERKKTKKPRAAKRKRLEAKRQRSETKRLRSKPTRWED
ncbi:MAG: aminoacyl-tRNA hydrolase, partial [Acidobacteria bacterium]|nr:aminoacyl-tRNA hydrolase [Acidobacteriota bacterium]